MLGFFLSCAVSHVRARSPIQAYKKSGSLMKPDEKTEYSSRNRTGMSFNGDEMKQVQSEYGNNRVMVVVNRSLEAKGALQLALTHAVQSQDTVVLLHVTKPCKQGLISLLPKHHPICVQFGQTHGLNYVLPMLQVETPTMNSIKGPVVKFSAVWKVCVKQ